MLSDMIFIIILFVFAFTFTLWYYFINDEEKGIYSIGEYGKKVKAKHIWRFVFFVAFSIIIFAYAFLDIQMNITKIASILINLVSLGVFFYDVL